MRRINLEIAFRCQSFRGNGHIPEIIWLELADEVTLVIHAMPIRPTFYDMLPQAREDMR